MKRLLFGLLAGLVLLVVLGGCHNGLSSLDEKSGVIDVISFNIRNGKANDGVNNWKHRKEIVADLVGEFGGDIIGVQEAYNFQAEYLAESLPQYGMYFAGRDDGAKRGESCAIYYLKDKYELVDSGTFWFSDTPEKPSRHWGNRYLRICSWVRLKDKSDGKGLYVYNLHLDHQSQKSREESSKLLAKKISQREFKDPYIAMGDFNMGLDNPGMKYLLKDGVVTPYPSLVSAWRKMHPDKTELMTGHGYKDGTYGMAIDHILVEEETEVLKANVDQRKLDGKFPSDHYPVTASVKLY